VTELIVAGEDIISVGWLDEMPLDEFVPVWLGEVVVAIFEELNSRDMSSETRVEEVVSDELVVAAANMPDCSGGRVVVVIMVTELSDELISLERVDVVAICWLVFEGSSFEAVAEVVAWLEYRVALFCSPPRVLPCMVYVDETELKISELDTSYPVPTGDNEVREESRSEFLLPLVLADEVGAEVSLILEVECAAVAGFSDPWLEAVLKALV
jgi:hypothetical protein